VSAPTAQISWPQGQQALGEEARRVTALLRTIKDPHPAALGQWSLGEVAAHLSQVWAELPRLARGERPALIHDVRELAEATMRGVRAEPERDLNVLADRIAASAAHYLTSCAGADPEAPRTWIVHGVTVPQSLFTYHLLSETVVHGYDIARAAGYRWRIDPCRAVMAVQGFLIPIVRALPGRAVVDPAKAARLRAGYELRIRTGDSFRFVFHDGTLSVNASAGDSVDCHISADPVALLLVAWNRQSRWHAIATGKLLAWGRKPWLAARFKGLLPNP
jgi:uncharacterized protein (TIGR03083 family)